MGGSNFFSDFFKRKFFYYGGKFSYGFYLYHMGIIYFFVNNFGKKKRLHIEIIFSSFVTTFAIGCIHYYLIEKNLIKLANLICNYIDKKFNLKNKNMIEKIQI